MCRRRANRGRHIRLRPHIAGARGSSTRLASTFETSARAPDDRSPSGFGRTGRAASTDAAGPRKPDRHARAGVASVAPCGRRRTTAIAASDSHDQHGESALHARHVQPEHMVKRPLANAGRSDGERDRAQHEVVLETTVGHPHAVQPRTAATAVTITAMRRRPRAASQPEREQRTTGQLGKTGASASIRPGRAGGTRRRRRFHPDRVRRRSRTASARRGPTNSPPATTRNTNSPSGMFTSLRGDLFLHSN